MSNEDALAWADHYDHIVADRLDMEVREEASEDYWRGAKDAAEHATASLRSWLSTHDSEKVTDEMVTRAMRELGPWSDERKVRAALEAALLKDDLPITGPGWEERYPEFYALIFGEPR